MNHSPPNEPQRYPQDEEVSLVDLTKVLIKRWKVMVTIFLFVVVGALAYVLLTERTYEYVSIYQVAEQEPGSALEAPNSVLARVSNLYMGPTMRELRESAGLQDLPFEVTIGNPSDTLLVRLVSEAKEANSDLVTQMHEAMQALMIEGQQERVEKHRASLEQQLQSVERALQAAEQSSSERASELIASYIERLADIQQRLSQLSEGEVVQVAVQSLDPADTSRSFIMGLALVLGGMLAVIAAFLAEFSFRVRKSLQEEKKGNL